MSNSILLTEKDNAKHESSSLIVLLAISVLICTFLRASLVLIYPLVVVFIAIYYSFRVSSSFIFLSILIAIGLMASLFNELFLRYKLLSLFYMLPFLFILFSNPSPGYKNKSNYLSAFIKAVTVAALVNDIIGFLQVLYNPRSDDSFMGIYSQFSISINGLMLINTVLFFYYLVRFIYAKHYIYLPVSLFFLTCSILGFYGAGLFVMILAVILSFFRWTGVAILRTAVISILSFSAVYIALRIIKPQALDYNLANIKKITSFDINNGPRKLTSFYNYATTYPKDVKDFLLGSGPGTFNSRSAFIIGSPSYFASFGSIKDDNQPYYFKNYAYTLWNEKNTIQSLYLDGFRNQPFSSLLSFLGEYGLLFTVSFFVLFGYYFNAVSRIYQSVHTSAEARIAFRFYKFLMIFLVLLLIIDNYFEYPEVMLLFLLGIKFSHAKLLAIKQNINETSEKTKF